MTLDEARKSVGKVVSWDIASLLPASSPVRLRRRLHTLVEIEENPTVSEKYRYVAIVTPVTRPAPVTPWKTQIRELRPLNEEERVILANYLLTEGA